nr:hypothetical protein [Tanacetum cinerariifolium]
MKFYNSLGRAPNRCSSSIETVSPSLAADNIILRNVGVGMEKQVKMNKLDGISESLIKWMRRSRELRDASLNKHGASEFGANPKLLKSILKHIQSPSKEGRKVSMNLSTMVWEVETDFASPIRPVFARDTGSTCVNKPFQVERVNVTVLNDKESRVSSTLNTSPNVNVSATDFEKDTTAKVQPASNKVHNSFASALKHKVDRVAEIVELRNEECVEGAAVTLSLAAIKEVSLRFENTLYRYFVGKRLAYQVVENYVKSIWSKYGLIRIQLHGDFFLLQFKIKEIMNIVLDYEVGLSLVTTQIGKPIQLDAYTSDMCLNLWGRSAYARALIKISADDVLKDDLVIAIPVGKDKGHSLATIRIEYEWKPPRCSTCLIFYHTDAKCPKLPKEVIPAVVSNVDASHSKDVADDGFEVFKKKKNRKNKHQKQVDEVVLNKPSLQLHYRWVDKGASSKNATPKSNDNAASTSKASTSAKPKVSLMNSFSALNDDDECEGQNTQRTLGVLMRVIVMWFFPIGVIGYFVIDSNDDSDDREVLNELEEYGNAGKLCLKKVIFDEKKPRSS